MSTTMITILDNELDRLEHSYSTPNLLRRMPTGLLGWDLLTRGLNRGGLHVLTGPPGCGLSSLALTIATNLVTLSREPALFVTELSDGQIARRAWASRSLVPIDNISSGNLTEDHWSAIARATKDLAVSHLRVQHPAADPGGLIELLQADLVATPAALLVLDDLPANDPETLHDLAHQHDVAVLVVGSQTVLQSGDFEHVADSITVVEPQAQPATTTRLATITVGHHRFGATGEFRAAFLEECLAWVDVFDTDTPHFGAAV